MICNCYICGKEFKRKPALIKRAEHPVCSRECQTVLKVKRKTVNCVICGKPLLRSENRLAIRPNPVCSEECRKELTHRKCFDPSITDEERQKTRKVPERMPFIRAVLERDDYTCQVCGKRGSNLAVHHLNGYSWDVENRCNPDNGVTLCVKCHKGFHHRYGMRDATKEEFIEYANQSGRLQDNT